MCGICGFISKKSITKEQLTIMNDTIIHRGPDDSGVELYAGKNGYGIGFAQRRLSILDLTPLGHQPMHSKAEAGTTVPRISVVYNGEIYNYLELKKELSEYDFVSTCDTELLIAAYLKWGKACFDRFNGMFAVALYDRETDEIILVRDRIGKKPLYYWYEDGNLVFASELKPIMAHPDFAKKINQSILARYISQQYIMNPDTIFENVFKLEPGSILTFKNGSVSKEKYWDVSKVYETQSKQTVGSYEEAKTGLKQLLEESVKRRMISDVPLGTFLSGGYDSSLITAIAAKISDTPVKTFSIGFGDKDYNEAEYAKDMVTGFIKLNGATVGVVANRTAIYDEEGKEVEKFDGSLSAKGCEKAADFVNFCDAFEIPVLTLTNACGFKACKCSEKKLAKAAAKLTYAFANATVPTVNVVIGKAFGTSYVIMNSKSLGADMTFAWDTAKVGMMDAKLAAQIIADGKSADEKKKVDNVVVFSDCQIGNGGYGFTPWYGRSRSDHGPHFHELFKEFKKLNPMCNWIVVNLRQSGGTSVFDKSQRILNIAGWSDKIFDVINSNCKGWDAIIKEIEAIEI